jgi:hypothetical protein
MQALKTMIGMSPHDECAEGALSPDGDHSRGMKVYLFYSKYSEASMAFARRAHRNQSFVITVCVDHPQVRSSIKRVYKIFSVPAIAFHLEDGSIETFTNYESITSWFDANIPQQPIPQQPIPQQPMQGGMYPQQPMQGGMYPQQPMPQQPMQGGMYPQQPGAPGMYPQQPMPQQPMQGTPMPQQPMQGTPMPQQPGASGMYPQQPMQGTPIPQQPGAPGMYPQQPTQGTPIPMQHPLGTPQLGVPPVMGGPQGAYEGQPTFDPEEWKSGRVAQPSYIIGQQGAPTPFSVPPSDADTGTAIAPHSEPRSMDQTMSQVPPIPTIASAYNPRLMQQQRAMPEDLRGGNLRQTALQMEQARKSIEQQLVGNRG